VTARPSATGCLSAPAPSHPITSFFRRRERGREAAPSSPTARDPPPPPPTPRAHALSASHTSPLSHYSHLPIHPISIPDSLPVLPPSHRSLSLLACLPSHHPPTPESFIHFLPFTHHLRSFQHYHHHHHVAAADSLSAATVLLSQLPFCLYSILQKAVTLPRTHDLPSEQTIRASNCPRPLPRVRLCLLCSCLPASPRSRIIPSASRLVDRPRAHSPLRKLLPSQ
jgi:hypothetical protein